MYFGITEVKPLIDYKLEITFENSEVKVFDMKPYLSTGIFTELKNTSLFNSVHVSFDTIEWNNGADLDPEILYSESISTIAKSCM